MEKFAAKDLIRNPNVSIRVSTPTADRLSAAFVRARLVSQRVTVLRAGTARGSRNGIAARQRSRGHGEVFMVGEFLQPSINGKAVGIDPEGDVRIGVGPSQVTQEIRAGFQGLVGPFAVQIGLGTSRQRLSSATMRLPQHVDRGEPADAHDVIHAEAGDGPHLAAWTPPR